MIKAGFFNTHSYKAEQATGFDSFGALNFQQDTVGTNAFDTSYGFANAAIGSFSSFSQASNYIEGNFVYDNREAYIQDNWKVNNRLTLDYGMRFVHMTPQYDKLGQGSNFLPDEWALSHRAGAVPAGLRGHGGARHRLSGRQSAGAQSADRPAPRSELDARDRDARAGSGNPTNGLFLGGQGIVDTTYTFPALASRRASAWRSTSPASRTMVLRGGVGLFYDRPFGNSVIFMPGNPPSAKNVTVRYGQLQSLGAGGLTTQGAPGAEHDRVRRQAAVVYAVQRRDADDDPVVDDARRGVGRSAQLQHRAVGEHQHRGLRLRVSAAESESEPGERRRPAARRCRPI